MRNNKIFIIGYILTLFVFSCGEEEPALKKETNKHRRRVEIIDPPNYLIKYIEHPKDSDLLCKEDIKEAKRDIDKNDITYCYPTDACFAIFPRQIKQLKQLCKTYNLRFKYETVSGWGGTKGQTRGCYMGYMDKIIAEKYGVDFKEKLYKQADSLLGFSNDTIQSHRCDTKPEQIRYDIHTINVLFLLGDSLRNQLKPGKEGALPFMDISFYIDKEGIATGYFLENFNDQNEATNRKLKKQLLEVGIKFLKQNKYWEPGKINDQKVITEHNIRIQF